MHILRQKVARIRTTQIWMEASQLQLKNASYIVQGDEEIDTNITLHSFRSYIISAHVRL